MSDYHYSPAPIATAIAIQPAPLVPRQPSPDPLADGMRDHYLAQARAAEQVRRIKVHAVPRQPYPPEAFAEDDGA